MRWIAGLATLLLSGALLAQSPPPCAAPAPLAGPATCSPEGYLVGVHDPFDAEAQAPLLASRYGFVVDDVYSSFNIFYTPSLTAQQVALLRCDRAVSYVERNLPTCGPFEPCDPVPDEGACAAPAGIQGVPSLGSAGRLVLVVGLAAVALAIRLR